MVKFISICWSYVKRHFAIIIALFSGVVIFNTVFALYSLPTEAVLYASMLSCVAFITIAVLRFISFYNKHKMLENIKKQITVITPNFPEPVSRIEKDYQEILQILNEDKKATIYEKDSTLSNLIDYYTLWAHQIKTPISAMRIILQSEDSQANDELLEQLFKIEQYVEMVLQYLRTESMSSDLVLQVCSLDSIIRQAVKKYSKIFIRKKIKLCYTSLECNVLTDEKWLSFVVEQLLSNALKYTATGTVSIYMDKALDKTLVIEDTGIGIQKEDLPRVFENGFTGYNGRADKKSTGIGLYLCKKILNKLSHTITIESSIGEGTRVKIGLSSIDIEFE